MNLGGDGGMRARLPRAHLDLLGSLHSHPQGLGGSRGGGSFHALHGLEKDQLQGGFVGRGNERGDALLCALGAVGLDGSHRPFPRPESALQLGRGLARRGLGELLLRAHPLDGDASQHDERPLGVAGAAPLVEEPHLDHRRFHLAHVAVEDAREQRGQHPCLVQQLRAHTLDFVGVGEFLPQAHHGEEVGGVEAAADGRLQLHLHLEGVERDLHVLVRPPDRAVVPPKDCVCLRLCLPQIPKKRLDVHARGGPGARGACTLESSLQMQHAAPLGDNFRQPRVPPAP
mmetsp:Transcript_70545/g.223514  ORF Transcript_70545/g.223514 Transcript_70545/m.223514 type:complete len:286 (+) Transcript_70545:302-1159(+)